MIAKENLVTLDAPDGFRVASSLGRVTGSASRPHSMLRATLRSINSTQNDVFTVNDLKVDLVRREVLVGETAVKLTATEYDLLKVLVHHAGNVRTHQQLIRELWGRTQYQDVLHLLRVTLSHLRRKLQPDPMKSRYIVTEPSVGYRLRTEKPGYPAKAGQHS